MGSHEDYDLGYEKGQQRAREELQRLGYLPPVLARGQEEYDLGYARGWNEAARECKSAGK